MPIQNVLKSSILFLFSCIIILSCRNSDKSPAPLNVLLEHSQIQKRSPGNFTANELIIGNLIFNDPDYRKYRLEELFHNLKLINNNFDSTENRELSEKMISTFSGLGIKYSYLKDSFTVLEVPHGMLAASQLFDEKYHVLDLMTKEQLEKAIK